MKEFADWARKKKIPFRQTSAVSGEGIAALFQLVASMLAEYRTTMELEATAISVETTVKNNCC
jgi:translation initiation factor IF-2